MSQTAARRRRGKWGKWVRLTLVALAISANFVGFKFKQTLNGLLILGSLTRSSTARHNLLVLWEDGEKGETMATRNAQVAVGGAALGRKIIVGLDGAKGANCAVWSIFHVWPWGQINETANIRSLRVLVYRGEHLQNLNLHHKVGYF